jgi:hypothetical protein
MRTFAVTFPTQTTPAPQESRVADGTSNAIVLSENVLGLSKAGSLQFTASDIVTDPIDRQRVAEATSRMLSLIDDGQSPCAGYFPANTTYTHVQLTRAAQCLVDFAFHQGLALRFKGAWQFLAAEPVTNPLDRMVLTVVLMPVASKYSDIELITAHSSV